MPGLGKTYRVTVKKGFSHHTQRYSITEMQVFGVPELLLVVTR